MTPGLFIWEIGASSWRRYCRHSHFSFGKVTFLLLYYVQVLFGAITSSSSFSDCKRLIMRCTLLISRIRFMCSSLQCTCTDQFALATCISNYLKCSFQANSYNLRALLKNLRALLLVGSASSYEFRSTSFGQLIRSLNLSKLKSLQSTTDGITFWLFWKLST